MPEAMDPKCEQCSTKKGRPALAPHPKDCRRTHHQCHEPDSYAHMLLRHTSAPQPLGNRRFLRQLARDLLAVLTHSTQLFEVMNRPRCEESETDFGCAFHHFSSSSTSQASVPQGNCTWILMHF